MALMPGLQRLAHALALHHRRSLNLQCATGFRLDVAAAVNRLGQRVDHAAQERVADGHRKHLTGALDLLALFDLLEVAEDDGADAVLVEVERHAQHAAGELEQLLRHHRGQALDVRDTVAGVDDRTDFLARGIGGETRDVILDRTLDVISGDGQLCHGFSSSCSYGVGSLSFVVGQSGSLVSAAASLDESVPSITSSPTAMFSPPSSSGLMCSCTETGCP